MPSITPPRRANAKIKEACLLLVAKDEQPNKPNRDVSQEYCEDLGQNCWPQQKNVTGQHGQIYGHGGQSETVYNRISLI